MGGRDYRHREVKKTKKDGKAIKVEALTPSAETEVVRKRKARKDKDSDDRSDR
jgi:hypothetical protein